MNAECNAKINIGLHVVAKRPDGYHDIETLFYPLPFSDYLEISASGKDSFEQTGAALDCPPEKNLVVRARDLLAGLFDLPPLKIRLVKKLPSGAGLGGGSSDAAFALKLINEECRWEVEGGPMTFLKALHEVVGEDGTIILTAFPKRHISQLRFFHRKQTGFRTRQRR